MDTTSNLHPLQLKTIITNTTLLKAIPDIKFVIVLPNGQIIEHGDLKVAAPVPVKQRQKRGAVHPIGTYTNYLRDLGMDTMGIGQVLVIDPKDYPLERLRAVACSFATRVWGRDSLTTQRNGNVIEIMRTR